jgi:hypothetical protein
MEIQGKRLQITNFVVCISLLFVFLSCKEGANSIQSQVTKNKNQSAVNELDTLKIQFNQFKRFVIEGKISDVKVFFDFPVKGDDLWYKVLDDKEVEKHLGNPFTEKDFEIYFDNIFINSFKECLSDIDVQKLFDSGKFSSKSVTSKENDYLVKSQIEATYSNGELKLVFNSVIQNNTSEFEAEHTEGYTFKVLDYRLKFATFYMAG